jgi:[acyl-carrier-protein] S-malonyltransferase
MSKIAFMFPGQGSLEAGMGRDIAEAVPDAMAASASRRPSRN